MCSRAIMLVTDGATEMYDDVFEKYNWPERKVGSSFTNAIKLSKTPYTADRKVIFVVL